MTTKRGAAVATAGGLKSRLLTAFVVGGQTGETGGDEAYCGRPLRVDGRPIIAATANDAAWPLTLGYSVELGDATRAALVADYTRDALLEHASIASFAVFTLELLAVGAPPELVVLAQSAGLDEVDHARMTFAIASAFAQKTVGPGPLALGAVSPRSDLEAITVACVRDGCIGETIASLVAAAQSERAEHPALQAALRKVADDEARHAELAWRFVRWAITTDRSILPSVEAAFAFVPTPAPVPPGIDREAWQANGRLLEDELAAIMGSAMSDVVVPCAQALGAAGAALSSRA